MTITWAFGTFIVAGGVAVLPEASRRLRVSVARLRGVAGAALVGDA